MIVYTQVSRAGGARYVYELVRHLGQLYPGTTLVCPDDFQFRADLKNAQGVKLRPVLRSSVNVEGRKLLLLAGLIWKSLSGALLVMKSRGDGRLVHANFPGLIFSVMPTFLLWRMAGKKILFTVHDVMPHRWLLPRFARKLETAVFSLSYHTAHHLIVHHAGAKLQLQTRFHIPPEKISVIPHGAFSLEADPLPMPSTSTDRIVLLFGSIRENKGIQLAIQAIQQLRSEGHPIALRICGSPSMSERLYWETCKRLIASAPDGIAVLDRHIADSELPQIIGSSHLLILPYSDFHSQSGVAALALSNGRPIIATRAGGLADVLLAGKTGVVISGPQVAAVKEALRSALLLSDEELQLMASNCAALFRTKYSWPRIAASHRALYDLIAADESLQAARFCSSSRD